MSTRKSPRSKTKAKVKAHPRPKAKVKNRRNKTKARSAAAPLLRTRCSAAQLLRRFRQLLPASLLLEWLALSEKQFYLRAFTPLITLWYCLFQRLDPNHSLSRVVEDARAGGADCLSPRGKRLSRQLRSEATTSFSDARQRLPLDLLEKTLHHTARQGGEDFEGGDWHGFKVGLLDGSTCRLRPLGDIPEQFPPHRPGNCKKEPYWCVARVVGLFSLATGLVLDSAMDCLKASEQALAAFILRRVWEDWLLVADRNFGVYSLARATVAAKAHLLARLTRVRAAKLARQAGVKLAAGLDLPITWEPSRHDQCPEGLEALPVQGRLLVVRLQRRGFRPLTLYLFTTLRDSQSFSALELAQLYGQRWQVELFLRYVKTQMELGFLECHSAAMARKEWLAGLIAYNLIRWTMAAAAAKAKVPLSTLSFSRARELLLGWCQRCSGRWPTLHSWKILLGRVAKAQLPKRRKRRPSEPRAIRPFQKNFAKLEGDRAKARKKLAKSNAKS